MNIKVKIEINNIINKLNSEMMEKGKLLDGMISVLNTAKANMEAMAIELKNCLNNNCSPDVLAEYLRKGWLLKKELSPNISNDNIEKYYEQAISSGALSGKILGAGSEGFMVFYCPQESQPKLIMKMQNLIHTKFSFEPEGSKIIFIS